MAIHAVATPHLTLHNHNSRTPPHSLSFLLFSLFSLPVFVSYTHSPYHPSYNTEKINILYDTMELSPYYMILRKKTNPPYVRANTYREFAQMSAQEHLYYITFSCVVVISSPIAQRSGENAGNMSWYSDQSPWLCHRMNIPHCTIALIHPARQSSSVPSRHHCALHQTWQPLMV